MSITIGSEAIDRPNSVFSATYIDLANPSTKSGTIDTVKVWFDTSTTGDVIVGTFSGTAPNFESRESANIGAVTGGSEQTFSGLNISVEVGDYIGIYFPNGKLELSTSGGSDVYWKSGNQFGTGPQTYAQQANDSISIQGLGTEIVGSQNGPYIY